MLHDVGGMADDARNEQLVVGQLHLLQFRQQRRQQLVTDHADREVAKRRPQSAQSKRRTDPYPNAVRQRMSLNLN